MFEYVVADIVCNKIEHAISIAEQRLAYSATIKVVNVKRVTEHKKGRLTTFTVVLMVRNV
jgi:hypothetical protein